MTVKPYTRRVQYHETDRMGVTHHANYLHWMEEARVDLMAQMGFPYEEMEARDVLSPVKSLSCEYLRSTTFGDEVTVETGVESFNGVVLTIRYTMRGPQGEPVFRGRSEHVFLNREGRFVRLRREMPDFCAALEALVDPGEAGSADP